MDMPRCVACCSPLDGPLPDDTRPEYAVQLDGEPWCAYCFRMAHPKMYLWLKDATGGYVLGSYKLDTKGRLEESGD